ncbi:MAG: DUF2752 domain-containing protein [Clostridiales bacterium]|jgi:hypothetical protein|nr:DUF2752 domain-containing protein [Clostridiales bacterium]
MEAKSQIFFNTLSKKTWFRAVVGVAVPLAFVGGLLYLYFFGNPFVCVFHSVTGFYSPGCGAGRALSALLRLDIGAALSYNLMFVLVLPFIGYYFLSVYLNFVFGRTVIPLVKVPVKYYIITLMVFVVFGIVRNIPVYPFTWLAP